MKNNITFNEKCYSLLKKVPKGKVTTYKALANALDTRAYRAVGNAMNRNLYKNVPCHRVIKGNGDVGGFAKGIKEKIKILKKEGIEIINGKIHLRNYEYHFN